MNKLLILLLSFLMLTINVVTASSLSVPEYLQSICVRVDVKIPYGHSRGSGIAFTRKDWTKTNDITFVWTAAHLFYHEDEEVLPIPFFFGLNGTNTPIIDHAKIYQDVINKDGEIYGTTNILAKLIVLSRSIENGGNDLALLQLEKPFFNTNTAVFDLSFDIPKLGSSVCSISCPYTEWGIYSLGIISFVNRKVDGLVFDNTTCNIYPGSSGGGIFTTDGKYIGMPTRMRAPQLISIIPVRRIHSWAKNHKVEWAMNPLLPIPNKDELNTLNLIIVTGKIFK
jgi:hypothetical protein